MYALYIHNLQTTLLYTIHILQYTYIKARTRSDSASEPIFAAKEPGHWCGHVQRGGGTVFTWCSSSILWTKVLYSNMDSTVVYSVACFFWNVLILFSNTYCTTLLKQIQYSKAIFILYTVNFNTWPIEECQRQAGTGPLSWSGMVLYLNRVYWEWIVLYSILTEK